MRKNGDSGYDICHILWTDTGSRRQNPQTDGLCTETAKFRGGQGGIALEGTLLRISRHLDMASWGHTPERCKGECSMPDSRGQAHTDHPFRVSHHRPGGHVGSVAAIHPGFTPA